ncbi:MAG TPA: DUF488 family protein [bacterium]|nr:DUF488 family protein [bacterium]
MPHKKDIGIKRAYDPPSPKDGKRFLVDRLWPRGLAKEKLKIEAWLKDAAPSDALRKWYGHDPKKWAEFRKRYEKELLKNPEAWKPLATAARKGTVTLVFGSKELEKNNAAALREFLLGKSGKI